MKTKILYKAICIICVAVFAATILAGCRNDTVPTSSGVVTTTASTTARPGPTYRLIECDPTNLNYDLSAYKVFDGDIGRALLTETDDEMLKEFAEKVSDEVMMTDDISCEVMYQGFSFAIIKIGKFWEWQGRTGVEEQGYYPDNSIFFSYCEQPARGDITAGESVMFDVYKDLSEHFIIVTQCRDYKIISELFERVDVEEPVKLIIEVNGHRMTATLEDNSSADALKDLLADGPVTIEMQDYSNFEKVGDLPEELPRNDEQIDTDFGDLILYLGTRFVIYYDKNSWEFTRLGHIDDITQEELISILGDGDVTVVLSLET